MSPTIIPNEPLKLIPEGQALTVEVGGCPVKVRAMRYPDGVVALEVTPAEEGVKMAGEEPGIYLLEWIACPKCGSEDLAVYAASEEREDEADLVECPESGCKWKAALTPEGERSLDYGVKTATAPDSGVDVEFLQAVARILPERMKATVIFPGTLIFDAYGQRWATGFTGLHVCDDAGNGTDFPGDDSVLVALESAGEITAARYADLLVTISD